MVASRQSASVSRSPTSQRRLAKPGLEPVERGEDLADRLVVGGLGAGEAAR